MNTILGKIVDRKSICGIDEAGRGSLAGPLVAASVQLKFHPDRISDSLPFKLKDGKLLAPKQRETVYKLLQSLNAEISLAVISTLRINHHGIGWANKEIIRCLIKLTSAYEYIIDGNLKIGSVRGKVGLIRSVVNADATIIPVICAGIVAKVARDNIMKTLAASYPLYGWDHNAGYGTSEHISAIRQYGTTKYHRYVYVNTALSRDQNPTIPP